VPTKFELHFHAVSFDDTIIAFLQKSWYISGRDEARATSYRWMGRLVEWATPPLYPGLPAAGGVRDPGAGDGCSM